MGLAVHIVRRYSRGDDTDDLEQVALLGLVRAVERYDPTRGFAFSTFAGRTIEGELKHHFRDRTWGVRVPRSLKDLRVSVRAASDQLTNQLGRAPTIREISSYLEVDADSVIEALGADSARNPRSLDTPSAEGDDALAPTEVADRTAADEFSVIEDRSDIEDLLAALEPREREIIELRFTQQMSQQQIADRLGISQMHVSRLLRRSLETLRGRLDSP